MPDSGPLWLRGNEDCSVALDCKFCDRGGMPIVWYDGYGISNPYDEKDVPTAHTISQLTNLGLIHLSEVHGLAQESTDV